MPRQSTAVSYKEVSRARVSESRTVVISDCSHGGFTIAQQLEVNENGKVITVFLKGAMHVDGVNELIGLRNAIDAVINEYSADREH